MSKDNRTSLNELINRANRGGKNLDTETIKNFIDKQEDLKRKKGLSPTQKVLIGFVTISGLALIPIPVMAYLRDRKKYVNTFIDFNIEEIEDSEIKFELNATVADIQVTELEGYRFDGWYSDKEYTTRLDSDHVINNNSTIYGRYIKLLSIKVIFNGLENIYTVDEGTTISQVVSNIQVDSNVKFSGWCSNADYSSEIDLTTALNDNCVIYGGYITTNKVEVVIDGVRTIKQIEIGVTLQQLSEQLQITDYNSCGWFIDEGLTIQATEINDNITIYTKSATLDLLTFTKEEDGTYTASGAELEDDAEPVDVVIPVRYADGIVSGVNFKDNIKISKVTLPVTVKKLEANVFDGCDRLLGINLHNELVEIGDYCFRGNQLLSNVHIPASVTRLGKYAFNKCFALSNITFAEESKITKILSDTFWNCYSLKEIIIPSKVESIGMTAFQNCYLLSKVILPDDLKIIYSSAFINCGSLKEIQLPKNLEQLGSNAFSKSSITRMVIPATVTKINGNPASSSLEEIIVEEGNTVYDSRNNCSAVIETATNKLLIGTKSTIIPETVTSIADKAFNNCTTVTEISIPAGVTTIENSAFKGCTGLTKVNIPSNSQLKYIGQSAFESCSSLISIDIPSSLEDLGNSAFINCITLEKVDFSDDSPIRIIENKTFEGCLKLKNISLPKSLTVIGERAFYGCEGLCNITLPDGLATIDNSAFANCENLCEINIPASVITINMRSFSYNYNLHTVNIPEDSNLTTIGAVAFFNCHKLTQIVIPSKVSSIGSDAFTSCSSLSVIYNLSALNFKQGNSGYGGIARYAKEIKTTLEASDKLVISNGIKYLVDGDKFTAVGLVDKTLTEITLDERTTNIGDYAFYKDNNITKVNINNGLTTIGACAFEYCTLLQYVNLADSTTNVQRSAFSNCTSLTNINIENVITIGNNAFSGCTALSNIALGNNMTSIGASLFSYCTSLTEIVLPSNISSVPNSIFSGCTSLNKVTLPEGVITIGSNAFSSCHELASIILPSTLQEIKLNAFNDCISLMEIYNLSNLEIAVGETTHGSVGLNAKAVNISTSTPSRIVEYGGVVYYVDDADRIALFASNKSATNIVLHEDTIEIKARAFSSNECIESIELPSGLKVIGDRAFQGCVALKNVIIPEGVTTIGEYAFGSCNALVDITIPSSVVNIGDNIFKSCASLTWATIYSPIIGDLEFYLCESLKCVDILGECVSIGEYAFCGCKSLETISISVPFTIKRIGHNAFWECYKLKDIDIDSKGWNTTTSSDYIGGSPVCFIFEMISVNYLKYLTDHYWYRQ